MAIRKKKREKSQDPYFPRRSKLVNKLDELMRWINLDVDHM